MRKQQRKSGKSAAGFTYEDAEYRCKKCYLYFHLCYCSKIEKQRQNEEQEYAEYYEYINDDEDYSYLLEASKHKAGVFYE